MKEILKRLVCMLLIFTTLLMETECAKGATTPYYNGYGKVEFNKPDTSSDTFIKGGEWADEDTYETNDKYDCYYLWKYRSTWGFPTKWCICGDDNGRWVSFYYPNYSSWSYILNAWVQIDGDWYYANEYGYFVTGWAFIPRSGLLTDTTTNAQDCGWFYFNEDGVMVDGWQKIPDGNGVEKWYYFNVSDVIAGSDYQWGECLYDNTGVPNLTLANSDLSYKGKTAKYVTGFTFKQNTYKEGDSGYVLESSTPVSVTLGSSDSCSKTVDAPSKTGYTLNTEKGSAGSVTNKLQIATGANLVSTLKNKDVNWYYKRSSYAMKLNANGGKFASGDTEVSKTLTYQKSTHSDLSSFIPTRNGYSFNGWWTKTSNGTQIYGSNGKIKNDGSYWKDNKSIFAKEHTLYAQWTAKKYTVTYDANGGELISGNETSEVSNGGVVSLALKAKKDGMLFAGWGLSKTDTKPLSSLTMPANDVTLYALYSLPVSDMKEAVLVSWSTKNSKVYNSFPLTLTKTENGDYSYSLSGINLRKGLTYSSNADILASIILYDNATNQTVIPIKGTTQPHVPKIFQQTVNHYLWNMEINDWIFYASVTEKAYENSMYTPKYLETIPSGYHTDSIDGEYKVTGATTKKAYYMPDEYTLYFNANGGNCDVASKIVYKDYFIGELPVATKKGYEFLGWYTESGTKISSSDRYEKAGDSTVDAHWKVDKFGVVYDYLTNGGDAGDATLKETDYESSIDLSVKAYKDGWNFVGWNINPKATEPMTSSSGWNCDICGEKHSISSMPDHDVILYAIYKKDITLSIVEQTNSGQTTRTKTQTIYNNEIDTEFIISEEPIWTGWAFLGWTKSNKGSDSVEVTPGGSYIIGENATIYGMYTSTVSLNYDTNGSSMKIDGQNKDYYYNASGDYKYPEFIVVDAPSLSQHSFVIWNVTRGSICDTLGNPLTSCAPGDTVLVKSDAVLTATWDKHPVIEAYDRYFTLEQAQSGEITETELLKKVVGIDLEDGKLVNGTDVIVKNYNPEYFNKLETDAETHITYQATDSFGNVVTKTIIVRVTDTEMRESKQKRYVRFISEDFFKDENGNLVPASEGGLEETSVWRIDAKKRSLLEKVLEEIKNKS